MKNQENNDNLSSEDGTERTSDGDQAREGNFSGLLGLLTILFIFVAFVTIGLNCRQKEMSRIKREKSPFRVWEGNRNNTIKENSSEIQTH